jgi:hypothetical protein
MAQSTEGRARIAYRGSSAGLDQPVTQNARALQTRQEELKAQREAMRKQAEQERRADRLELLKANRLEEDMWPAAADAIIKEYNQLNDNAAEMSWEELAEQQSRIKSLEKKYSGIWATQKEKIKDGLQGKYAVGETEDGKKELLTGEDLTEGQLEQLDGGGFTFTDNIEANDEAVMESLNGALTLQSTARDMKEVNPKNVADLASNLASEVTDESVSGYYNEDLGKVIVRTKSTIGKEDRDRIREVLKENYKDALLPRVLSEGPKTDEEIETEINDWADQFIAFEKDETDVLSGSGAREEQSEYDITPVPLEQDRKSKIRTSLMEGYASSLSGVESLADLAVSGQIEEVKKNDKEFFDILSNAAEVEQQIEESDMFADFPYSGKLNIEGDEYNVQNLVYDSETGDSYAVVYKPQEVSVSDYQFKKVTEKTGEKDKDGEDVAKEKLKRIGTESYKADVRNYRLMKLTPSVNEQLKNLTGKDKVNYQDLFNRETETVDFSGF